MATSVTPHAHAGPQGFIRKYIFSLDHKVIGIQYFFLALTAVWVGVFLSLLMGIYLFWAGGSLPLAGQIKTSTYFSFLSIHSALMLFFLLSTGQQCCVGQYSLPIDQFGA